MTRKFTDQDWKRMNEVHSEQRALAARVAGLEEAVRALAGIVDRMGAAPAGPVIIGDPLPPARNYATHPAEGFSVVRDDRVKA